MVSAVRGVVTVNTGDGSGWLVAEEVRKAASEAVKFCTRYLTRLMSQEEVLRTKVEVNITTNQH